MASVKATVNRPQMLATLMQWHWQGWVTREQYEAALVALDLGTMRDALGKAITAEFPLKLPNKETQS